MSHFWCIGDILTFKPDCPVHSISGFFTLYVCPHNIWRQGTTQIPLLQMITLDYTTCLKQLVLFACVSQALFGSVITFTRRSFLTSPKNVTNRETSLQCKRDHGACRRGRIPWIYEYIAISVMAPTWLLHVKCLDFPGACTLTYNWSFIIEILAGFDSCTPLYNGILHFSH